MNRNTPKILKLSAVGYCVAIFILVFSSLRGWVVLNLDVPSYMVYGLSSLLLIALSVYGFAKRVRFKSPQLISLRNFLLINLLFGALFMLGEFLLGRGLDASFAYIFLLPYILFIFLRVPVSGLHIALGIIALGIAFSVFSNFIISMNASDGFDYLIDYNTRLRPDSFEAMSKTGEFLRVGGYTGSYHDAANILGMFGSYYFVKFLIDRELMKLTMAVIMVVAMTLTQSAANIVLALTTCLIFALYVVIRKGGFSFIFILLVVASLTTLVILFVPEVLVFTKRVGADGDYEGIATALSVDMLFSPYFWVGHGYAFNSKFVDTEIAFLKGILQFGIVHAALLYWILIYPAYIFVRSESQSIAPLPYLAAIVFGFLSLAHYGSLFRSTNIAIFYAMYALFFINVIADKESKLKIS